VIDFALLLAGLAALIIGTRISVKQAILIAQHYRLSDVFIGVALLSIGSDLPEIVISLNASAHQFRTDTSGLIIGNAIGSNFSQIGLIMGITGLFGYLVLGKRLVVRHGGVLLGSILYLYLAALDNEITRIEGGVLVLAFVIYVVMLFGQEPREETAPAREVDNLPAVWVFLLLGMVLVVAGSEATVRGTVALANSYGVSQSLIGIVVIGIGSSLPELTISLEAVRKARGGMSVGNLLGSNIIDTLLPIGLAGMIHPLTVEAGLVRMDLPFLFVLSLIVLVMLVRRKGLQKPEAILLIVIYGIYLNLKFLGY